MVLTILYTEASPETWSTSVLNVTYINMSCPFTQCCHKKKKKDEILNLEE